MANKWWEYWIPGWSQILATRDLFTGNFLNGKKTMYSFGKYDGVEEEYSNNPEYTSILGEVQDTARQEYLEDREHTEAREDTAYQRAVADMQSAGLNPYTVGANPSPSSQSTVGENSLTNKLQVLGYMLDLKNLDIKNKGLINQILGTVVKAYAKN